MRRLARVVVAALGGNAVLQPGQKGTAEEQQANIRRAAESLARVVRGGYALVVTHGNGPQVGNLLLQQQAGAADVPPLPLDACVAMTQGLLGYWLQRELRAALAASGCPRPVAAVVTQVVVDPSDGAFADPRKPVGPFFPEAVAREKAARSGWVVREDAGRGWRRVVPSPAPRAVVEVEAVAALLRAGVIPVACGGGGVPVVPGQDGSPRWLGIEAVVDKDLASAELAVGLGAELLAILTDVAGVYLDYGRPGHRPAGGERPLEEIDTAQAEQWLAEGQFAEGSMAPKVRAAVRFVRATGRPAVIGPMEQAAGAVSGRAGTRIVPAARAAAVRS